ncbi:MAG TPA: GNAT family N-acetyltransferase [Gaiellaceae bacterium]
MKIDRVTGATDEVVEALARLVPQLGAHREPPSRDYVAEIVANETLLVARDDDGTIVGTLTLVLFGIPSARRARIEDVIVDASARGQGVGEALTREGMRRAADAGVRAVELSSNPSREAANRLYQRVGFERRETNVYVWYPQ